MSLLGRQPAWHSLAQWGSATALAVLVGFSAGVAAKGPASSPAPDLELVSLVDLPKEAQETERLIRSGGPFPYAKDGATFGNRERVLPAQKRGYYKEYTVKTPGSRDRGARRIVCGGRQIAAPDACFYTDDHYASFRRIAQ